MNLPYVAVTEGDTTSSVDGRRPAGHAVEQVPLTYRGEVIGHLAVASRHPGTRLPNRDLRLLTGLAHQLAIGMYAVRASQQIQASRATLVTAREEERRRIRRDLHDGLGPTLASMKLQLDRGAAAVGADDAGSGRPVARRGARGTWTRPRPISAAWFTGCARRCSTSSAWSPRSAEPSRDATGPAGERGTRTRCPTLPAAVEVALYRIASEAIHNAVRHSGGRRAR